MPAYVMHLWVIEDDNKMTIKHHHSQTIHDK